MYNLDTILGILLVFYVREDRGREDVIIHCNGKNAVYYQMSRCLQQPMATCYDGGYIGKQHWMPYSVRNLYNVLFVGCNHILLPVQYIESRFFAYCTVHIGTFR